MVLSREDVEAVARRVVQLIQEKGLGNGDRQVVHSGVRLVDAATVANALGVARDWVYAHAAELGAIRIGGENGRLRFDLEALPKRISADEGDRTSRPSQAPGRAADRRYNGAAARSTWKR